MQIGFQNKITSANCISNTACENNESCLDSAFAINTSFEVFTGNEYAGLHYGKHRLLDAGKSYGMSDSLPVSDPIKASTSFPLEVLFNSICYVS